MRQDQSQTKDHEPPTCLVANLHSSFPLHLSPFFCFPASRHYVNIRGKHVLPSLCVHSKRYINTLTVLQPPIPLYTFSALYKTFHDNSSFLLFSTNVLYCLACTSLPTNNTKSLDEWKHTDYLDIKNPTNKSNSQKLLIAKIPQLFLRAQVNFQISQKKPTVRNSVVLLTKIAGRYQ